MNVLQEGGNTDAGAVFPLPGALFVAYRRPGQRGCNPKRGTGILNNELYVGRMVWNRLRYVKNPDTGKRISRLNPTADWIAKETIVNDELWAAAKARQSATHRTITHGGNIGFP